MTSNSHWTARSNDDFRYSIAADYADQLTEELESKDLSQRDLAKRIGVSDGRVSQLFNSPGNLTLKTMIDCVRAVGLKLSVVVYDDRDALNAKGPIMADVFRECWLRFGSPRNWIDLYGDVEANACFVRWGGAQTEMRVVNDNVELQHGCLESDGGAEQTLDLAA